VHPLGVASWLPSAAAAGASSNMVAPCGGEFGVDYARIRSDAGLAASGGRVSGVK
jgi:hypothetical protein